MSISDRRERLPMPPRPAAIPISSPRGGSHSDGAAVGQQERVAVPAKK